MLFSNERISIKDEYAASIDEYDEQSSLHRLTCQNQDCEWKTIRQDLKIARRLFVVMLIPDELVDCE